MGADTGVGATSAVERGTRARRQLLVAVVVGALVIVAGSVVVDAAAVAAMIPAMVRIGLPIPVIGVLFLLVDTALAAGIGAVGGVVGAALAARGGPADAAPGAGRAALVGCLTGAAAWVLLVVVGAVLRAFDGLPSPAAWSLAIGLVTTVAAATVGALLLPRRATTPVA